MTREIWQIHAVTAVRKRVLSMLCVLGLLATIGVVAAPSATAQAQDCGGQLPVPANLALDAQWADASDPNLSVVTSGIWAAWWYNEFDLADDVDVMLAELSDVRCDAILRFGQMDPPNPAAGSFVNVYVHNGVDDDFPEGWGNGVGTNANSLPFMTLPASSITEKNNTGHEGFHVMTWASESPGFGYSGDSQWYIETSAQWFAAVRNPNADNSFVEGAAIEANPHIALWHSFDNEATGDPINWYYQVRQYAMHTLLFYLDAIRGVDSATLGEGFYNGTTLLPQQYIASEVGLAQFSDLFADWAAANVSDFDYLTRGQVDRARLEATLLGPAITGPANPTAATWSTTGTGPSFERPPEALAPRGWAYNVITVENPAAMDYTLRVQGDSMGSEGAAARFGARVVLHGPSGYRTVELPMPDAMSGEVVISVQPSDDEMSLVVASVPDNFTGNQNYNYQYMITTEDVAFCNGKIVTIDMATSGSIGTSGDDVILGTSGDDVIDAGDGNDTVCAGDGDDVVIAGDGDDYVLGGNGRDLIRGNPGVDTIFGGAGRDRLLGGIGDDRLDGGADNDYLGGFGGADTILGGAGSDTIFGGFGADIIAAGDGNDEVHGLIGNDTIDGGAGNDALDGDRGNDTINGGSGNDVIRGGNANDALNGDDGDDDVSGGKGDDQLSGGNGVDVCIGNREIMGDSAASDCETVFGIP